MPMNRETYSFAPLLALQRGLDEEIMRRHGVTYENSFSRRLLALFVELGEFANETRAFKYWSLKGPSPKDRILDEYSDALHFFLSLGLAIGIEDLSVSLEDFGKEDPIALSDSILGVYEASLRFAESRSKADFEKAFHLFLALLPKMGYGFEDMEEAYKKKLAVNYKRQETAY